MCGSSSTTRMRSRFPSVSGTRGAGASGACAPPGSSTVNVAPPPGLVSSVMRPPCSFRIPWQIDSPSPVPSPSPLVVKNGSNTCAAISSAIPGPESVMLTATPPPARCGFAATQMRPLGASLAIAWFALLMRFTNTCLIWLPSTSTSGSPGSTSSVASTSFARSQEGERKLQPIGAILESTLALLRNQLMANKVEATLEVEPGLPDVEVDGNQIKQVFVNLINNANQAIASDAPSGRIWVAAKPQRAGAGVA